RRGSRMAANTEIPIIATHGNGRRPRPLEALRKSGSLRSDLRPCANVHSKEGEAHGPQVNDKRTPGSQSAGRKEVGRDKLESRLKAAVGCLGSRRRSRRLPIS